MKIIAEIQDKNAVLVENACLLKYKISILETEMKSKDYLILEFNKKLNANVANDNMKRNKANERVNTSRQKISDKTSTIYTGGSAANENPSWSSLAIPNFEARPLEVAQRSKMIELINLNNLSSLTSKSNKSKAIPTTMKLSNDVNITTNNENGINDTARNTTEQENTS
ncbi:hypothetical protein WA026_006390 [Henosepilachna vigintioctopunctata]|uniref:Uncharacterized protein n=1 Tax=Henosepilachna vigintioctopunctata TaxID=420089 RepID=A0AAW1TRA4_9CUCU